jgi:hypothetical protein
VPCGHAPLPGSGFSAPTTPPGGTRTHLDAFTRDDLKESRQQPLTLTLATVATLAQQAPHDREGHTVISDAEHQDVEVNLPDLPVRAVQRDHELLVDGYEGEQETRERVEVDPEAGEEALQPSLVALLFRSGVQGERELGEADSTDAPEGKNEGCGAVDAGPVPGEVRLQDAGELRSLGQGQSFLFDGAVVTPSNQGRDWPFKLLSGTEEHL